MENRFLIVVDMQNDFVGGSLGSEAAQAITPAVLRKVAHFPGKVIFTQDTHGEDYLETQEGKRLPVKHCIKGTPGWKLIPALEKLQQEHHWPVIQKPSFGSVKLAEDLKELNRKQLIQSIELIGLCTDICVVSNALLLKAALPEVEIRVDSQCCAGVTEESHQAALATMRSCQVVVE